MPESNTPADAGTATDGPLSFEEGLNLLATKADAEKPQPDADSSKEDQPSTDKPDEQAKVEDAEDEEDKPAEPPKEDVPEWDATEPDAKPGEGTLIELKSENDKLKLPDGTVTTFGEYSKGHLRQDDYTRKTQQVAQERNVLSERWNQVQQLGDQVIQQQELTISLLAAQIPPEPETIGLVYDQDPLGYLGQKEARDRSIKQLQQLNDSFQNNRLQLNQQQQFTMSKAAQERQQQELGRLLDVMPQLKDQKKREAYSNDIVKGMTTHYGFQPAELSNIVDHRFMLVATDAIRHRRAMANKDQAQKQGAQQQGQTQKSPVIKSGFARPAGTESAEIKALRGKKSLSLEEATLLDMADRKISRRK